MGKEIAIGEILTVKFSEMTGILLLCQEGDPYYPCLGCYWNFPKKCIYKGRCMRSERQDDKNVIFQFLCRFDKRPRNKNKKERC